jgi:hypothetical protein
MCNSSVPAQANTVLTQYRSKIQSFHGQIAALHKRKLLALAAIIASVVLLVALLIAEVNGRDIFFASLAIPLFGAVYAIQAFMRFRGRSIELARRSSFYERGIDRKEDNWRGNGNTGVDFQRTGHMYQSDLDILGEGSLFELICTTRSAVGAERLATYLLDPPSFEEAKARQDAVKELRNATELREEIALLGKYQFLNCDGKHLRDWLSLPTINVHRFVPVSLFLFSAMSLMLGTCICARIFPWAQVAYFFILLLAAQASISLTMMHRIRPHLHMLRTLANDVAVLRQGVGLIERQDFHSAKLRGLIEQVCRQDAAVMIRKLERMLIAISKREDQILYGFCLWLAVGTQLVLAVERWRALHQNSFEQWLDAWAEFEALNALACYAYECPDDSFPELLSGGALFEARGLCHPLLSRKCAVGNDVDLNNSTAFYVISGSNMAGKSTYLRAIGLNAILAFAGAPVCAVDARISVSYVCASISVEDSLLEGKSKFLAEVERLRESIRIAAGRPVLFLIDEILSGTNSIDRRIAAESVIKALIAEGAVGALSTHDLALTEIGDNPQLRGVNVHMQSDNPEQPLAFDYRVKPGISRQTNGLAMVRMMGITD